MTKLRRNERRNCAISESNSTDSNTYRPVGKPLSLNSRERQSLCLPAEVAVANHHNPVQSPQGSWSARGPRGTSIQAQRIPRATAVWAPPADMALGLNMATATAQLAHSCSSTAKSWSSTTWSPSGPSSTAWWRLGTRLVNVAEDCVSAHCWQRTSMGEEGRKVSPTPEICVGGGADKGSLQSKRKKAHIKRQKGLNFSAVWIEFRDRGQKKSALQ